MDNIFKPPDIELEHASIQEVPSAYKAVPSTVNDIVPGGEGQQSVVQETVVEGMCCLGVSESNSLPDNTPLSRFNIPPEDNWASPEMPIENRFNGQISNHPIKIKESDRKSSKDEKQRQNEEIVILESSSLSSETGSWESVFPPKVAEKELCEKFIIKERQCSSKTGQERKSKESCEFLEENCPSLVQKSPFKSTSCFIDAASLVDEEDETIEIKNVVNEATGILKYDGEGTTTKPMPCCSTKPDMSPNDWSENNENDDSLEQTDTTNPDNNLKDLSPTIFDMTPITEDSLCTNVFESHQEQERPAESVAFRSLSGYSNDNEATSGLSQTIFLTNTPNNSIMSLRSSKVKQNDSEHEGSDLLPVQRECNNFNKPKKFNESSPIVSGGASIEDYLPQTGSHTGSPMTRRKIENMPIVCGAYVPEVEDTSQKKHSKPSSASAWVVDMSKDPKYDRENIPSSSNNTSAKKPGDKTCENLKLGGKYGSAESCNKSRSSLDSDSSDICSRKFYVDLASLPDSVSSDKNSDTDNPSDKKNIFSMYIDLGEKSNLKEMPARLSSSLNARKPPEVKSTSKISKSMKTYGNKDDSSNIELNFEKYETLCEDPNISISDIIRLPENASENACVSSDCNSNAEIVKNDRRNEGKDSNIAANVITEEPATEQPMDLFVKLSDLDKPVQRPESSEPMSYERLFDVRMTRSIPEDNWADPNTNASRSVDFISSFHSENAQSLNRLFPHLRNEFSRSVPGFLSGPQRASPSQRMGPPSPNPGDASEQASDVSELSSLQSSACRSIQENSTTEETESLIGNSQSRLGQDLLRMFLEEIAPDVVVEVSGRRIKAHKCILSSRCQYFAGILSGGWVESAGNIIVLPPFSFSVVHFALCHIYSGASTIPDSISIVELATVADMLGLEGLKEAIMFTLKARYCHNFHRPCPVCIVGVLECFPLCSVYGLDDLYHKCLKWITKYFSQVWPTKSFATLPKELLDKCYQQLVINMTPIHALDTVFGCGLTVAALQNSRWAETVARMCRRLINVTSHYVATRLLEILQIIATFPPHIPAPASIALDDCFAAAIEWAPPEETCRAYAFLAELLKEIHEQQNARPDLINNGGRDRVPGENNLLSRYLRSWKLRCEGALVRAAPRVVGTQVFRELPLDLRKRLRELGCIMYGAQVVPVAAPPPAQERRCRSSAHQNSRGQSSQSSRSMDLDRVRASFVTFTTKDLAPTLKLLKINNDLRDKKSSTQAEPPKVRTTKAQEERAKFNLTRNNPSQDRLNIKPPTLRPLPFDNVKPKYLEPKIYKDNERKFIGDKIVTKIVSSSESSRNSRSSPIQPRNSKTYQMKIEKPNKITPQAMSQDSLATSSRPRTAEPSTDSLSESLNSNKYATYTKIKHTAKGSIESGKTKGPTTVTQTSNNSKIKTKIPVYLNQNTKVKNASSENSVESQKHSDYQKRQNVRQGKSTSDNVPTTSTAPLTRNKTAERKMPGSLMKATKSSSAKIVPKIVKENNASKTTPKPVKRTSSNGQKPEENKPPGDIPVMERSGTFLKDEPTFGDKTIDIDEQKNKP